MGNLTNEQEYNLVQDIGHIKGTVEGIEQHLKTLNGSVARVTERVQIHDRLITKYGVTIAAILFFGSIFGNLIVEKFFQFNHEPPKTEQVQR